MLVSILLIIVGFVFLIIGANVLVDGSSGIAKKFRIPEIIIGLTIVSIGTSMPELFVSITSALGGYSDMSVGNVIGSNVCNLLLILGLSSIIKPVMFKKETIKYEIPICLTVTIIFMIFCNTGNKISVTESIVLLLMFVLFILYTICMARKMQNEQVLIELKQDKEKSIINNVIFIILGIIALKFGGDFVVDNSVIIARNFNLSEKIISITILAFGTSLPELVTSITAAIKGNSDIAIGNIIGSNIFNFLLIIGVSSVIKPIIYNSTYNLDLFILLISTIILALFPFIPPKKEMSRANGIVYFVIYITYITILFVV